MQKVLIKKFEEPKNGFRERERDCSYLPETNQASDFSVFQFNIQRGKSDAIFVADFLFFNMNDPRLPYKDDAFDDEAHIGSPDDDLLEKVEEMNEEPRVEP